MGEMKFLLACFPPIGYDILLITRETKQKRLASGSQGERDRPGAAASKKDRERVERMGKTGYLVLENGKIVSGRAFGAKAR